MTITMNLEVEIGVSFKEIASVLSVMQAEYLVENIYLKGNFKSSLSYFVFRCFSVPEKVAAEGVSVDWEVGMSGAFHCSIGRLSESSVDIMSFLKELSIQTVFKFALSFQYESLYAIRDDSGVVFLKHMVG